MILTADFKEIQTAGLKEWGAAGLMGLGMMGCTGPNCPTLAEPTPATQETDPLGFEQKDWKSTPQTLKDVMSQNAFSPLPADVNVYANESWMTVEIPFRMTEDPRAAERFAENMLEQRLFIPAHFTPTNLNSTYLTTKDKKRQVIQVKFYWDEYPLPVGFE